MKTFFGKHLFQGVIFGLFLGALSFLYFTGRLNQGIESTGLSSNLTELSDQEAAEKDLVVRLKIPKLGLNADIEHVGLTLNGAMDVPKDPWDVAWFHLGPRPGEEGSAVIAGHRDSKDGKAVFYNLDTLRPGDLLSVEDASGRSLSFVVRESRVYDANQEVPEVFSSKSGIHLNLITCDGEWNASQKSYAKRLVVFTDISE